MLFMPYWENVSFPAWRGPLCAVGDGDI